MWPNLYTTYYFNEMAWMKNQGHHIAVVSLKRDGSGGDANVTNFGLEDVPVLQLEQDYESDEHLINEVIAFGRQQGAQMIDAHLGREPANLALQVHLITGIPYAVRMYGGEVHSHPARNVAQIVQHASAVCPLSQYLADLLLGQRPPHELPKELPVNLDPAKLRVCHLGVPAELVAKEPAPQRDDLQIIGSIGRLAPVKRHSDIIQAVADLVDEFPGLKLRIIGGGQLMDELQNQAQALGIAGSVEITGPKSWHEVMRLAGQLHIYVQASQLEGFCQATIEAASQGLPLVLTRTGIHEQCVDPGVNGCLFDAGDVPALREHLRHLILKGADRRRQMGAASLEIVRRRFLLDTLLPRIEAIFQAVIAGECLPA
jgi:glycosyltransferase involved in cell wall biosynthesis